MRQVVAILKECCRQLSYEVRGYAKRSWIVLSQLVMCVVKTNPIGLQIFADLYCDR